MEILVLGTGCAKCSTLLANVHEAVADLGIAADIRKISELKEIMKHKLLMTPGLVVNGVVKSAGRVPAPIEIQRFITEARG